MDVVTIEIDFPKDGSVILGHSHFIKTVEDIYEAIVNSNPNIKFGIAFNEASGKRLVRYDGNDQELIDLAVKNAMKLKAGHTFIIVMKDGWPINILNSIKNVAEVVRIYAATSNPLKVVLMLDNDRAAIVGVMDGHSVLGIENENDKEERHKLLRTLKYKR